MNRLYPMHVVTPRGDYQPALLVITGRRNELVEIWVDGDDGRPARVEVGQEPVWDDGGQALDVTRLIEVEGELTPIPETWGAVRTTAACCGSALAAFIPPDHSGGVA